MECLLTIEDGFRELALAAMEGVFKCFSLVICYFLFSDIHVFVNTLDMALINVLLRLDKKRNKMWK